MTAPHVTPAHLEGRVMTTRAVLIESFDDAPHLADRALPEVDGDGVRIRVLASSINAFDWKVAEGRFKEMFRHEFPVTIGRDYAGVVEQIGADVTRVAPGDEVFGYFTGMTLGQGAFAEQIVVGQDDCFVPLPGGLSFRDAACLPLCGVVAYRCVAAVNPEPGERHLVVGATGGVGSFAIQLLHARGAFVLATGKPGDQDYLRGLGADEIVGYDIDVAGPLDGLVDTINYQDAFMTLVQRLLAPGSRAASLHRSADPELLEPLGVTGTSIGSQPDRELLARIGDDAAAGRLRVPVQREFLLEEAPAALFTHRDAHVQGKYALAVADRD